MKLFVLMKNGVPFELPVEQGTETENRLMEHDNGVGATYATASTVKQHVEAMRQALPDLLDADYGPEAFEIAEFTS
jgi:hypothetical protein